MLTYEQIGVYVAKGGARAFTRIRHCNPRAANPAKYATIRMDGEELTN
jgi:hypothetical protein